MWPAAFFFDVSYWAFVSVTLINMVAGIIIDSFGQLRDLYNKANEDMTSKCFICGINAAEFNRVDASSFDEHTHAHHNMWYYLYFREYLRMKDPNEYTGQESYVSGVIKEGSISYVPIGKAM